jgi:hydrogenase expression/formation protein HypE
MEQKPSGQESESNPMMETERVLLDHGSGGRISHSLTQEILLPVFGNSLLEPLDDGAVFEFDGVRLAFSTDSYTVEPLFFPGGSIGDLAVNGTVNDVTMCGAAPLYLSVGLIIEEGFPMNDLRRIIQDMGQAAEKAGVVVATGDTKVVPKGAADGIFINTTGIGRVLPGVHVSGANARVGDRVLLSGSIADHGATVMIHRQGMHFDAPVRSDSAPLNHMVAGMFQTSRNIHALRDPTRGGLGTALNEIAGKSNVGIRIEEDRILVRDEVAGICELLGFDPLYLANEGKLIAFVDPSDADDVLAAMRDNEFGKDARIIGEVIEDHPQKVFLKTRIGGTRILDMLTGEQLPRIC